MENKDAFIKTFPFVWIYTIVISLILLIFDKTWSISFALGSVTSLMTMSMLYKSSARLLVSDKTSAQKLAVRNYAFRFVFYAVILVVSGIFDETLEILATAVGLFSFKIVFYVVLFVESRGAVND